MGLQARQFRLVSLRKWAKFAGEDCILSVDGTTGSSSMSESHAVFIYYSACYEQQWNIRCKEINAHLRKYFENFPNTSKR